MHREPSSKPAGSAPGATLVLQGPDLDPPAISTALGLEPTFSTPPRARITDLDGTELDVDWPGVWALGTAGLVPEREPAVHLRRLLDVLTPRGPTLRRLLAELEGAGGEGWIELPWTPEQASVPERVGADMERAQRLGVLVELQIDESADDPWRA